jgi:hypothetical protein
MVAMFNSPVCEVKVTIKDATKASPEGTCMVIVLLFDIVARVKTSVSEKLGLELPEGYLFFDGEMLEDDEKLSAYGIKHGASLDFVFGASDANEVEFEEDDLFVAAPYAARIDQFASQQLQQMAPVNNTRRLQTINEIDNVKEISVDGEQQKLQELEELLASVRKLRALDKLVDDIDNRFVTPPCSDASDVENATYIEPRPIVDRKGQQWLQKESKSKPGRYYYCNPTTGQTVWKKPGL